MDLSVSGTPLPVTPKSQTGCLLCLGLYSQTVRIVAHRVLLHIKKTKLDIIFCVVVYTVFRYLNCRLHVDRGDLHSLICLSLFEAEFHCIALASLELPELLLQLAYPTRPALFFIYLFNSSGF